MTSADQQQPAKCELVAVAGMLLGLGLACYAAEAAQPRGYRIAPDFVASQYPYGAIAVAAGHGECSITPMP